MNEKEQFLRLYNDALIKAAIGVHIITTVGDEAGVDHETQDQNIATLCGELADGIQQDVEVVITDVMRTLARLPEDFFQHPGVIRLRAALKEEMNPQFLIGNRGSVH